MDATLTFREIERRYDSQWVLLADLQVDKYECIKRARVLWHSPDKDEVSRKAVELKPGEFAFLYMGEKTPKDVAVILEIENLAEGSYLATSSDLPGLVAQGRTIGECVEIAQDVAHKLIESYLEHGDPLPAKLTTANSLKIDISIPVGLP